jgi:hypothetical protein
MCTLRRATWHSSAMNEFRLVDSDIDLLRAARTDPDAFGDFYRRHAVADGGDRRWLPANGQNGCHGSD